MVVLYSRGVRLGLWADTEKEFVQAVQEIPIEFRDEAGNILARTIPTIKRTATAQQAYLELSKIVDLPLEVESNDGFTNRDHDQILYGSADGVR